MKERLQIKADIDKSIAVLRGYYGYSELCDKLQECSQELDALMKEALTHGRVYQETKFGFRE
jgi:hypothetical protein